MGFPLGFCYFNLIFFSGKFSDRWASVGGAPNVVVDVRCEDTRLCLQQNKTVASSCVLCVLMFICFVTIAKMSVYVQKRKKYRFKIRSSNV